MRSLAGVLILLLALVACGSAPTQVAAVDKAQAKRAAERQVAEAEAFALDAQRAIDQAEAAVKEAERVVAEQRARAAAEAAADAARRKAAQRAARSAPRVTEPRPAVSGDIWAALARCESGGNPRAVSKGGTYRGAFQFSLSTWRGIGESGDPIDHSYEHQLAAAKRLQARSGWGQWPVCSRRLGLR